MTWLSSTGSSPSGNANNFSVFADEDNFNDFETNHTFEPTSLLGFEIYPPDDDDDDNTATVPEPEALWLLLAGLIGLSRRRKQISG